MSPSLMTDPQSLRAFVMVAREGSVSRAAARLHLSQPAVSLQLKALAQATGLSLFSRSPRGLVLTADGAAYYERCVRILDYLREADEAISRVSQDKARNST